MRIFLVLLVLFSIASDGLAGEKKPGEVKVYRFENLNVQGKVKSPQLMYFLKRIRARFQSFRLPKQNFNLRTLETEDSDFLR
jgi:hypothetical protein